jgi:hypothetical protein
MDHAKRLVVTVGGGMEQLRCPDCSAPAYWGAARGGVRWGFFCPLVTVMGPRKILYTCTDFSQRMVTVSTKNL